VVSFSKQLYSHVQYWLFPGTDTRVISQPN